MSEKILYREGYKYQLEQAYVIATPFRPAAFVYTPFVRMDTDGTLYINSGYAWDGASGPTLDTKDSMRASLVHDALYQLMRLRFLPEEQRYVADDLFHQICLQDGMGKVRAAVWHWAVRIAGGPSAAPSGEREVLAAPA